VRETAIPGIWWISHKNADDDILTEFIEITRLPAILQTQAEDLHEAPARLRLILQDLDDNSPIESSNGGTNDAEQ
jgi:hydrogenase-1 operon protein HyaF